MRFVAGRCAGAKLLLAGALMRMAEAFLAEKQLAARTAANGRARRCAEASGRGVRQASARLARKFTMGEALHDGQAPPRQGNRLHIGLRAVARYFCLGGALRGYILSITSMGTPRIRCSCLFVAE